MSTEFAACSKSPSRDNHRKAIINSLYPSSFFACFFFQKKLFSNLFGNFQGIGEWNTWWLMGERGFETPAPLKKRSFSVTSTLITGCYDDELELMSNAESAMKNKTEANSDSQPPKIASRPLLYERRGSALFDLAKSKSSQRIKRRRNGIITINKPLLILEENEPCVEPTSLNESTQRPVSSSSISTSDSLETLDEKQSQQRRTGYAATNPRDSGVFLAFDNGGFADCDGSTILT